MSFQDWVNQDTGGDSPRDGDEPGWAFSNAAHARAQAERQSNRSRRRHTWRARAVLARRTLSRKGRDSSEEGVG